MEGLIGQSTSYSSPSSLYSISKPDDFQDNNHNRMPKDFELEIVKSVVKIYFNEAFESADCSEYEEGLVDFSTYTLNSIANCCECSETTPDDQQSVDDFPKRAYHPNGSDLNIAIKDRASLEEIEVLEAKLSTDVEQNQECPQKIRSAELGSPGSSITSSMSQWIVANDHRIPAVPTPTKQDKDEPIKSIKLIINQDELHHSKRGHGDFKQDYRRYSDIDKDSFYTNFFLKCTSSSSCTTTTSTTHNSSWTNMNLSLKDKQSPSLSRHDKNPGIPCDTDITVLYMKPNLDKFNEYAEEVAEPEILDYIHSMATKRSAVLTDDDFLKESRREDTGFYESWVGRESVDDNSVCDERFIGRADIFRPLLSPLERRTPLSSNFIKVLGVALVPDVPSNENETCTNESKLVKVVQEGFKSTGSNGIEIGDPVSSKKDKKRKFRLTRLFFNNKKRINSPNPSVEMKQDRALSINTLSRHPVSKPTRISDPNSYQFQYLKSIEPYPENRVALRNLRDLCIKTIKWQSKFDKVLRADSDGNNQLSEKSRIQVVKNEYKILKEDIKKSALQEDLQRLSKEFRNAEEDLIAKYLTSKEMLRAEFDRKINKLTLGFLRQNYFLSREFERKFEKIQMQLNKERDQ